MAGSGGGEEFGEAAQLSDSQTAGLATPRPRTRKKRSLAAAKHKNSGTKSAQINSEAEARHSYRCLGMMGSHGILLHQTLN